MSLGEEHCWRGIYRDLSREHGWETLRVEGELPEGLTGTLYRNGPALFSSGGRPYRHAFDGDGAIAAVRLGGGGAVGAVRVVQTRWLREERAAGRQLYRSYADLGRGLRRWLTLPKNQANISVLPWQGRLFALWEAGLPIELDPVDLSTIGESTVGGAVGPTFSAHPHEIGGEHFNFGLRYGPRFSLVLYALGSRIERIGEVPLRFPTLVHDFLPTERHFVFFCPPRRLHLARLLAGMGSFVENLRWEPSLGTEILIVSRADPDRCVRFEVDAFFLWHLASAREVGDDIIVDLIRYDDDETDRWFGRAPWETQPFPRSSYVRARIDLQQRRFSTEVLLDRPCEFPAQELAREEPSGRCFLLTFDRPGPPRLARLDIDRGSTSEAPLGESEFPSEPMLVHAAGTPYVLSLVYDGQRDASYLGVWDAERWPDPPLAKVWFDHGIPFTLHGAWDGSSPLGPRSA